MQSHDLFRLFLNEAKSLRAYLGRRIHDPADAEELFQDLSMIVLRHRTGPKDPERFSAWCRGLARHMLSHHLRARRRRANLLDRVAQESASSEPWHRVDPERMASARQLLERLGARLDPKAQELLSQRYALGETTHEIAERLDQSPAAVRMRLMRVRSVAKGHFRAGVAR